MWPYSKKDLLAIHRKEDHHVNVAAYLHGLAASLASHATQHAWNKPNIVGLEETDADESLGRPIIASDIVRAVPEAFRHLGSMEG